MNKPDNKPDSLPKALNTEDQPFWRALQHDAPVTLQEQKAKEEPVELSTDLSDLNEDERDQRRRALRSMLAASEARQQQMLRSRPPTFAAGVRVAIKSGPHKGNRGTILDADFIHSRALIDFNDGLDGHWIEFSRITSDNTTT